MTETSNNGDDQRTPVALLLSVLTSFFALTPLLSHNTPAGTTGTDFALMLALFPMLFLAIGLVIYGVVQAFTRERERGYFVAVTVYALPLPILAISAILWKH